MVGVMLEAARVVGERVPRTGPDVHFDTGLLNSSELRGWHPRGRVAGDRQDARR